MTRRLIAFLIVSLAFPGLAAPHEARLPLRDGRIRFADLSDKLLSEIHCGKGWLPIAGSIDVHGIEGARFVDAMNHALGDGCRINVDEDSLILHVDCEKMPAGWDATMVALRVFTAHAAPENTAAQQRQYGLSLPEHFDSEKRLVVLVHGLACNSAVWNGLSPLFAGDGYQVATFSYPAAGAIADSAEMFGQQLAELHRRFPALKVDVVTHSMGALVARSYIEGPDYAGGVDHLILLVPPNHGSTWVKAEFAAKLIEHYELCRHDPDWHWTWMVTDGLGEAARDLEPTSPFLSQLNELPRRADVKYTIVAGDQNPGWRMAGHVVGAPASWVPQRVANWWGFRQTRHGLENAASSLLNHHSKNDGPVSLNSAKLSGVDDFVVLHVDHATLLGPCTGKPPAVWETVRDRLSR